MPWFGTNDLHACFYLRRSWSQSDLARLGEPLLTTGLAARAFPISGPSLLFSTGYPSPPFACKIFKTNELFCDYVLDL